MRVSPTGVHRLNLVAAYSCLEAWTHQLVNLSAKDLLGLNPLTMGGNCAYRRSEIGARASWGGAAGPFSEDIEVALAGGGGMIRFVRDAVADHIVADSLQRYLNQRFRWSRGLMAPRHHARGFEAAFVAAGYLD